MSSDTLHSSTPPSTLNHALGNTAQYTAYCRSLEATRPDALIRDPYGKEFAGTQGKKFFELMKLSTGIPEHLLIDSFICRTKYFDDVLMDHVRAGVRQVVIAGVGGDVRAYRLPLPSSVRVFELDFPAVTEYRRQVFARVGATPVCSVTPVPCDLSDETWIEKLRSSGYNAAEPSLWLAEGLLMYLDTSQMQYFLKTIHANSAPGSIFTGDIMNCHYMVGVLLFL
jgi:methyltransferase (TIGR00027 family)